MRHWAIALEGTVLHWLLRAVAMISAGLLWQPWCGIHFGFAELDYLAMTCFRAVVGHLFYFRCEIDGFEPQPIIIFNHVAVVRINLDYSSRFWSL